MSQPAHILYQQVDYIGIITLNRPEALNALSLQMVRVMYRQLMEWAHDDSIKAVVIHAPEGRAFCAGGDVRWLYEAGLARDPAQMAFFDEEYQLNLLIGQYPKPYISIMDGMTMGGGVGISLHGSHPVATDRFIFAMPETSIGFFPDIGASYLLNQINKPYGIYLGLTGERIDAMQSLHLGLIHAVIPHQQASRLIDDLIKLDLSEDVVRRVEACIHAFSIKTNVTLPHLDDIDYAFSHHSMKEVMTALESINSDFSKKTKALLESKSPSALSVTLEQLHRANGLTLEQCLDMDRVLVKNFMNDSDFYEGVRALLVDKDKSPRWNPATINEINSDRVHMFFK